MTNVEEVEDLEERYTELEESIRASFNTETSWVITHSDIQRCPKKAWSPRHYHPDGTCRCSEREEAQEALRQATELLKRARAIHEGAKAWYSAT